MFSRLRNGVSQAFPPAATFTEKDLPDLAGKVYIVSGANTGVGLALAGILFSKNAKVYVATRSKDKADAAIASLKKTHPDSKGGLVFLSLDLADLTTIKASASQFLAAESRLDVLFNNAGVMAPPQGAKTAQGHDLQLGTNCIGTFLFTQLLTPKLVETAKTSPPHSVRVVWVSSSAADWLSPTGGVDMDNIDDRRQRPVEVKYGISKAGNYYHATEYARRHRADGVISNALNPGNLRTELFRHRARIEQKLSWYFQYDPVNGAYTELFAGLSPEVTLEKSGEWIVPFGRFLPIREDLERGSKPESEGGTGIARKFWEWTEEQVKAYL